MLSTSQVVAALKQNNPEQNVSEETLRRAIRLNPRLRPEKVGGAFVWLPAQVSEIASYLGLEHRKLVGGDSQTNPERRRRSSGIHRPPAGSGI